MAILVWRRPRSPFNMSPPIFRRSLLLFSLVLSSSSCRIGNNQMHLSSRGSVYVFDKHDAIAILFSLTEASPLSSSSSIDDSAETALVGAELVTKKTPLNRTSKTADWKQKQQDLIVEINQSGGDNSPVMATLCLMAFLTRFNLWHILYIYVSHPTLTIVHFHKGTSGKTGWKSKPIHIPCARCLTAKWEANYTDHVPSPHDAGVVSAGTAVVTDTAYHQLSGDSVSTSDTQVFVWSLG